MFVLKLLLWTLAWRCTNTLWQVTDSFPTSPHPPTNPNRSPCSRQGEVTHQLQGHCSSFIFYNSQTLYLNINVCERELETLSLHQGLKFRFNDQSNYFICDVKDLDWCLIRDCAMNIIQWIWFCKHLWYILQLFLREIERNVFRW